MRKTLRSSLLFPSLAILICADSTYAGSKRVITAPQFDEDARQVELFAGMEDGTFATKVIPLGPQGGNLLISNTTVEILTVKLPESFVAVQVLKQFQLQPPDGNNPAQPPGGGGQQQDVGGGPQANNQLNANPFGGPPNGNANGAGNGFFSIPPERTIKVSYVSACLEHGKPNPTPRANYKLVRTEDYTQDRTLQAVIAMVASGRLDQKSAQAAVWHCSDDMSWKQLAEKYSYTVLGKVPYFKARELKVAQAIVKAASKQAAAFDTPLSDEAKVAVARTK